MDRRATPGPDTFKNLVELREALGKVQPLADYRGNFSAIQALVTVINKIEDFYQDVAHLVDLPCHCVKSQDKGDPNANDNPSR